MAKTYRLREQVYDELLPDLLSARGVSADDAAFFLEPDFARDSHDPFLLPDMEVAVGRVLDAVKNNEKVCVWSDYDCDGVPGGVMLTEFLRTLGLEVRHYIPHRHLEGYGLNNEGIEELATSGVTLIITIDLGTTERDEILFAKEKGIDVIVTDHHIVHVDSEKSSPQNIVSQKSSGLLSAPKPDAAGQTFAHQHSASTVFPAFAFINPKRQDSMYPFDGLCGAGVAWKLVQGILQKHRPDNFPEGQEKWLLDLVGLATLSDMVPLVGENRMLAHFGLRVMRRNRRPGLAALLQLLRIDVKNLTEDDVGFMLAPRINAASRMDNPDLAARLLAASGGEEAEQLARELNRINDERKGVVAAIVKEINKRLADTPHEGAVLVMGNPNWRPGVLGLVANSLMESHGKPVFLWGREGGTSIKGSCRSDGTVSVVDIMAKAGDVLAGYGGHTAAGGFSVEESRVHELHERLEDAFLGLRSTAPTTQEVVVDRAMTVAELSHAMRDLARLAPFGEGNRKPLFMFPKVQVGKTRLFGKTANHLEIELVQDSATTLGIAFFSTSDSFSKPVIHGTRVDIVGHVEADWRGRPRIRVVDVI